MREANGMIEVLLQPTLSDEQANAITGAPLAAVAHMFAIRELHDILGHASEDRIHELVKHNPDIRLEPGSKLLSCEVCGQAKHHRAPIAKGPAPRATKPGEVIHSDICGPMSTQTFSGKRYFVSFVDDFTRYAHVALMRKKSEVPAKFQAFLQMLPSDRTVRLLHSNRGGEYTGEAFQQFLKDHHITFSPSPPRTPEYNGVAERFNRTIVEMTRAMLIDASLPKTFWGEALSHSVYLNNRLPTKANNNVSPYELWTGMTPILHNLKPFGSKGYVLKMPNDRGKLDAQAHAGIYLGPDGNTAAHRMWNPICRSVSNTRDVRFLPRTAVSIFDLIKLE